MNQWTGLRKFFHVPLPNREEIDVLPQRTRHAFRRSRSGTRPGFPIFALASPVKASSCSTLEPAATIEFLRDPLAFHWAIPSASSIFARPFLRLRWSLA